MYFIIQIRIHDNARKEDITMLKEFKEFALKGNVVDLAVGVIIGGAFGKIVTSLVNDIIMPLIGILLGGMNFTDLKVVITPAQGDIAEVAFRYGAFFQTFIDFLIISFSIFLFIKLLNSMKKKEAQIEETIKEPSTEEKLLTEIRDLLKENDKK